MELSTLNTRVWKPIKCEINFPDVDWDRTWELTKIRGLDSNQTSFLFKLLHNILPTASRLHRLSQKPTPTCSMCPSGSIEDRVHALLGCSYNGEVSTANDIVNLNLEIAEPMTFPLIWSLALVLSLVWQFRVARRNITLYSIRAEVEARIKILRKSRFQERVQIIETLLNL